MRTVTIAAGTTIHEAARQLAARATEVLETVRAEFNGLMLEARPGSSPEAIVRWWAKQANFPGDSGGGGA